MVGRGLGQAITPEAVAAIQAEAPSQLPIYCSLPGSQYFWPTVCVTPLPAPVPVVGPQTQEEMLASPTASGGSPFTPDIAIARTVEAQKKQYQDFFTQLAGNPAYQPIGGGGGGPTDCCNLWNQIASSDCKTSDLLKCSNFWITAGVVVGGMFVLLVVLKHI
jgi:hypothetical protein